MSLLAHVALIGWIPIVLLVFASLPERRALAAALVGGWLFLPVAGYAHVTGYQDKHMVLSAGLLLGALLFAPHRLAAFRLRLVDVPMLVWCVWPYASSIANGLGAYEGAAAIVFNTMHWGVPWVLGRVFFADRFGLRRLAVAIVLGAAAYVPLCLWEIRMSPQLHTTLYGFHQHAFIQTVRSGGSWRPMVFMHHGLMVAFWMAAGAVIAVGLWRRSPSGRLAGVPLGLLAAALVGTTYLMKSAGAAGLLAIGVLALLALDAPRIRALLLVLAILPPAYMVTRVTVERSAELVVAAAGHLASPDRVGSLDFRLRNEAQLAAKALQRPMTGWGRYGRWLAVDDSGRGATPDGFWVIALGQFGLVGLVSFLLTMLVPVIRIARGVRGARAATQAGAGALAIALVLALFAIDSAFNAMMNPIYTVAAGALAGIELRRLAAVRVPRVRPRPALVGPTVSFPSGSVG